MDHAIEKREARLLQRENYLRRTRYVAFCLGIGGSVVPIVFWFLGDHAADLPHKPIFFTGLFFFVCSYATHLQIRHVESIKYHREAGSRAGADLETPMNADKNLRWIDALKPDPMPLSAFIRVHLCFHMA